MQQLKDDSEFAAARERMVDEQIAARGVRDWRVLEAMRAIPRERFVPHAIRAEAYEDRALPIDCGQTISQPYMVGLMTATLCVGRDQRVLEVGTGSGYQTAVLSRLAAQVFTIERHAELLRQARDRLDRLGLTNVCYRIGDGSLGWPEEAPFDGILVTAGAPRVPENLIEQLAIGGRLVVPIGEPDAQMLVSIERTTAGPVRTDVLGCRFVKLIGAAAWPDE
ncbi:MAG: protein-L-isoaspartate(D-aspartate) O-methyltransferase [Planctomycetota bacterium]|nr:MAG: protein-L-isoaspartate(D-aspartate) O-methyltransferase [Planctomycetota bacterium]